MITGRRGCLHAEWPLGICTPNTAPFVSLRLLSTRPPRILTAGCLLSCVGGLRPTFNLLCGRGEPTLFAAELPRCTPRRYGRPGGSVVGPGNLTETNIVGSDLGEATSPGMFAHGMCRNRKRLFR